MPSQLKLQVQFSRHRADSFTFAELLDSSRVCGSCDLNSSAVKKTDAYSRLLDGCKKTNPNAFFNAEVSLWLELGGANSSCLCWKGFPVLGVRVQGHESKHTCRLKTIKMTMQEIPSLHLVTSKLSFHMLQSKNLKMLACREVPVWCYGQEGTPLESAAS